MKDRAPPPRITEPFRDQGYFCFAGDGLPADHAVRLIDRVLATLDLAEFTADAKAVEGTAGRSTLSPRMKLTLWLYALTTGVGSAREIARLVLTDAAFRWVVGDVSVSHQTLSAFRVGHLAALDELFTQVIAVLMHKGLLCLALVAQDGTRVRASASAPSFRTEPSLEECREQAALHLKAVRAAAEAGEASGAAAAHAMEVAKRVDEAIEQVQLMRPRRNRKGEEVKPRASTTDPDARVMKMPDGGFRPGYNVQLAVAGDEHGGPRTIVGVNVTNVGSDMGSVAPMVEQVHERTGVRPGALLADANHASHACIEELAANGVRALISVPEPSKTKRAASGHSPEVAAWRERMEEEETQRLYRARAGLCELVNAHVKSGMGLAQVLVRGLPKVTSQMLLGALAFNVMQHAAALLR